MFYQWFAAGSPSRENFFLLQCRTRGAKLPPQTDFPGCWLTASTPRVAPMFRRTCVSVRLSVASRPGWRAKSERVLQPFLTGFSASLAAFSELVNTTVVLAARARQSSTNETEVIHSMGFLSHGKFCVRLGPSPKCKADIFHTLAIQLTSARIGARWLNDWLQLRPANS